MERQIENRDGRIWLDKQRGREKEKVKEKERERETRKRMREIQIDRSYLLQGMGGNKKETEKEKKS